MNKNIKKSLLFSFMLGVCGAALAYPYAHQELYNPDLDMTVHLVYDYHDVIPGIKKVNKALIDGFCALDKKSAEPINLLWELDTDYWRSCAHTTTGNCMIPVGMKLSDKLNNAVSFIPADTMRHSAPLSDYADFLCEKWYEADEQKCSLDMVLSATNAQELQEALDSARAFVGEISENNNGFAAVDIESIDHDDARNYAQKTWNASAKRIRTLCCSGRSKRKADCAHAVKELKEDLFTGVADLEFFTKLWVSPESCQIMYAGGDHCHKMACTLCNLGFEEVAACGTEQHGNNRSPDLLKPTKLFALLQA